MDRPINPSVSAARALLRQHQQTDMLRWLDSLPAYEQEILASQIRELDLSVLHLTQESEKRGVLEPMRNAIPIAEAAANCERYTQTGLAAIRAGKVGAVVLAGGHGSRLGFEHPKGMYNIGITKPVYIFERIITNLLDVVKETDTWIRLFIMTSEKRKQ